MNGGGVIPTSHWRCNTQKYFDALRPTVSLDMTKIFYIIAWLLIFLITKPLYAASGALPVAPEIPTAAECQAFQSQVSGEIASYWSQQTKCMTTPSGSLADPAPTCKEFPTPHIVLERQGWAHCQTQEDRLCSLYNLRNDAKECFRIAQERSRERENKKDDELRKLKDADRASKKFDEQIRTVRDGIESFTDPKKFYDKVLSKNLGAPLELHVFDRNKEFTKSGQSMMQETYDYLFGKTIGNEHLRDRNPIISAIQGSTADEIRRLHSYTIFQAENALAQLNSFDVNATTNNPSKRLPVEPIKRSGSDRNSGTDGANAACSEIDSQKGQRLKQSDPSRYQSIKNACEAGHEF